MLDKIRHLSRKIDIISLYLINYNTSFSGREIARKLKINHQTALTNLNELVNLNILTYIVKGRNKEYSLNLKNISCRMIIEMAEQKNALSKMKNKEIKISVQDILPYTDSLILFGSFSSGNYNTNSDIDFVALGKSDKKSINNILKKKIREINIKYITYREFEDYLKNKNALVAEILKNHCLFGNVSSIIKILLRWYIERR